MTEVRPRRTDCLRCGRPERACLCRWIRPVANPVEVLLLQHPLEVDQAKGSARLLSLSLSNCRVRIGEWFDHSELATWLQPGASALLYPQTDDVVVRPVIAASAAPIRQLVVLDATWRKSRKMLHLNPLLATLPRLALQPTGLSAYAGLRKAHRSDQLSTLEATCLALAQLEAAGRTTAEAAACGIDGPSDAAVASRYAPLLAAFGCFVADQLQWRPAPQ
ncbi:MAG: tRNA-uridine aminocarboxypropyltransferase [Leptothrix sp. (in: b-proteobacteria)]